MQSRVRFATVRPHARSISSTGFSLPEALIVLVVVGILAGIALPPLSRMRTSAALQNGRAQLTAALSFGQATSVRWGRTTQVAFDTATDAVSVRVDTSRSVPVAPVVVREYQLGRDLGVQLRSDRTAICYNNRGVGTTGVGCPSPGAQLIIVAGVRADTLRINSAGRVWR